MTTNLVVTSAAPDPWPVPNPTRTFPWVANIVDNGTLFIIGILLVAAIGTAALLLVRDRFERRRLDGGLHPFRPYYAGRRAGREDQPMATPVELSGQSASAWTAGYNAGRQEPTPVASGSETS